MSLIACYNVVVVLKAVMEVAGLALFGQGVLALMAGHTRDTNVFYRVLAVMTAPVRAVTRRLTPRFVLDTHIGLAAFALVAMLWLGLYVTKVYLVLRIASASLPA
ncbi:MAG: YggT family protein [Proteobacteria bacterium]|nr:YggT family protein [Burkholderiales bacterium]